MVKSHLCGVHPTIPPQSNSPHCETFNGSPRFASIYFSCAPENQGKAPGGQAAEAEKMEETAAATEAQKEVTVPGETVARCLYENIEYSGTLAGSQAHTQNLTECQVSCLHVWKIPHLFFHLEHPPQPSTNFPLMPDGDQRVRECCHQTSKNREHLQLKGAFKGLKLLKYGSGT